MRTIISVDEAKTLGRPIGKVAEEKILSFITEVEQTIIRKAFGDDLYHKFLEDFQDNEYDILLNGGEWNDKNGNYRYIKGLKTAIAYYVYAQNVRAGDFESTRFGMVVKDYDYSNGISSKDREVIASSATEIAEAYVKECLDYCKENGIRVGNSLGMRITSGCVIRKIKI